MEPNTKESPSSCPTQDANSWTPQEEGSTRSLHLDKWIRGTIESPKKPGGERIGQDG